MNILRRLFFTLIVLTILQSHFTMLSDREEKKRKETRGVWIWWETVKKESAEKAAEKLARYNMNMAILLVKGTSGVVVYPSKTALRFDPEGDILKEMIGTCHKRGIEVHAWIVFHRDKEWLKANPHDAMHHCGKPHEGKPDPYPVDERICPLVREYRHYIKGIIEEIITCYDVDGIHLDYIRYPHMVYCFCDRHKEKAQGMGIDFEKVRQAVIKTLYEEGYKDYFIEQYKKDDEDIVRWVDMRTDEITSFIKEIKDLIQAVKPEVRLSAAFMHEGAVEDDAFALCHYAQNYRTAGSLCDFICPMSYHKEYAKPRTWIAEIAKNAERKTGKHAFAGIQAFIYDRDKIQKSGIGGEEIAEIIKDVRRKGIKGFVLFRYGTMTDAMWEAIKELLAERVELYYRDKIQKEEKRKNPK